MYEKLAIDQKNLQKKSYWSGVGTSKVGTLGVGTSGVGTSGAVPVAMVSVSLSMQ